MTEQRIRVGGVIVATAAVTALLVLSAPALATYLGAGGWVGDQAGGAVLEDSSDSIVDIDDPLKFGTNGQYVQVNEGTKVFGNCDGCLNFDNNAGSYSMRIRPYSASLYFFENRIGASYSQLGAQQFAAMVSTTGYAGASVYSANYGLFSSFGYDLSLGSGIEACWTNNTAGTGGSKDVGLSRVQAAVVGVTNCAGGAGALKVGSYTSDPCGTYPEGTQFYNSTSHYYCYCDGTNDVQMHDPTTACF